MPAPRTSRCARSILRYHGPAIVDHPHFTPERIGRFVRCASELAAGDPARSSSRRSTRSSPSRPPRWPPPTAHSSPSTASCCSRCSTSRRARSPTRPLHGGAAARDRGPPARARRPGRPADRPLPAGAAAGRVVWVHPSWRDLVIDALARNPEARRRFLRAAGSTAALALSHARRRGRATRRPLLVDDADWDAAAERIHELVPELGGRRSAASAHEPRCRHSHGPTPARPRVPRSRRRRWTASPGCWRTGRGAAERRGARAGGSTSRRVCRSRRRASTWRGSGSSSSRRP